LGRRLLDAPGLPDAFPASLLAACQAATSQQTFDAGYFSSHELHQNLRDLREMERWSIVRGATKVRFLVW